MSRLYVYALAASPLTPFTAARRRVYSIDLGGVHVVADRRPLPVTPSEDTLRRQHAIVEAIALRADAVLPARYGSLVELDELRRLVVERGESIRAALEAVRGREQMTLRIATATAPLESRGAPASGKEGTAYLEARKAAALPPAPALFEPIRQALAGLIHGERIQPGRGGRPGVVCHLISRGHADDYRARVAQAADDLPGPAPRVSGPWPAFAFVPEMFE